MTTEQNNAFNMLVESWAHHQDLRSSGAPIAELATSRFDLDAARLDAARSLAASAA